MSVIGLKELQRISKLNSENYNDILHMCEHYLQYKENKFTLKKVIYDCAYYCDINNENVFMELTNKLYGYNSFEEEDMQIRLCAVLKNDDIDRFIEYYTNMKKIMPKYERLFKYGCINITKFCILNGMCKPLTIELLICRSYEQLKFITDYYGITVSNEFIVKYFTKFPFFSNRVIYNWIKASIAEKLSPEFMKSIVPKKTLLQIISNVTVDYNCISFIQEYATVEHAHTLMNESFDKLENNMFSSFTINTVGKKLRSYILYLPNCYKMFLNALCLNNNYFDFRLLGAEDTRYNTLSNKWFVMFFKKYRMEKWRNYQNGNNENLKDVLLSSCEFDSAEEFLLSPDFKERCVLIIGMDFIDNECFEMSKEIAEFFNDYCKESFQFMNRVGDIITIATNLVHESLQ